MKRSMHISKIKPIDEVRLLEIAAMPDSAIDTSEMKEWTEADFARAKRLYTPIKRDIHIRLDADVIEWLKRKGKGYQTRANEILRKAMLADVT
jgi:uncharacterized protein (DUF4415 family)